MLKSLLDSSRRYFILQKENEGAVPFLLSYTGCLATDGSVEDRL